MYRNLKSKIVHIAAHGGAEAFSCGVRISSDYELIYSSQFLDLRKCKRCATSKPIRTVGQITSGLKKWRLSHEKEKREKRERHVVSESHRCRQVIKTVCF